MSTFHVTVKLQLRIYIPNLLLSIPLTKWLKNEQMSTAEKLMGVYLGVCGKFNIKKIALNQYLECFRFVPIIAPVKSNSYINHYP